MNTGVFREILYWGVILFFSVFIVNSFFAGGSDAEGSYLIFFAGILLVSIGSRFVFESDPEKMSIVKAVRKAREKSFLWWMPFAGLLIMAGGVIAMFYLDSVSTIVALIALFLSVVVANLILERLSSD